MLEKKIENTVSEYARSNGMMAYKFSSPGRAAVPDRMMIYNGLVFFIEYKAEGKKPTPAQQREHAKLRDQNMVVFVVDNIPLGKEIIDLVKMGIHPQQIARVKQ